MPPCRHLHCEDPGIYRVVHKYRLWPGFPRMADDGWWSGLFCHQHLLDVLAFKLRDLDGDDHIIEIRLTREEDLVNGKIDLRDSVERQRPWYSDPRKGASA